MKAEVVTGGFRPAQRLIDLANLCRTTPHAGRDAIAGVLAAHGESQQELAGLDDGACVKVRDVIDRMTRLLTERDPDRAARAINDVLEEFSARPMLSNHDGHFWHLHVCHGDDATWAEWLAASSALALAQLLSVHGRIVWGACAAADCYTLFLDNGPGSARRYCSTRCATRDRVAKHRAKRAAAPPFTATTHR